MTPTLIIPGASGPWTFTIDDAAGADSDFAPLVYEESGPSTRIPASAGLQPGRLYTWTARQDGMPDILGSFTVDTQLFDVQHLDRVGGVDVGMATGEVTLLWNSHAVHAVAGQVGFSLRFAASTPPQNGLPTGWRVTAASSSPFDRIDTHADGTLTLHGVNGLVVHYRNEGDGRYVPFEHGGGPFSSAGTAPVVASTPDGQWFVATTRDLTTVFERPTGAPTAFPVGAGAPDEPMLRPWWEGGRLRSVVDPVSQRTLDFVYAGEDCPAPPVGFISAPPGLLCAVRFWDGSSTALHYTTDATGEVRLSRLVDRPEAGASGAEVTDMAYDAAGRLAATRSPLVAAAVANGIIDDDPQFTTQIIYDDNGRAATVTEPAASPGAVRCQRRYDYLSSVVTSAFDSCLGAVVTEVEFDAATLTSSAITGSDGRSRRYEWDEQTLQPLIKVEADGTTTTYGYETDASTTTGPTRGSLSQAPVITHRHDEQRGANGTMEPLRGLHMVAWSWTDLLSRFPVSELGPTLDGIVTPALTVNWPTSPSGVEGPWSAVLSGEIVIDTAGIYRFRSNTANATLRVGNVLCDDERCDALVLGAGRHPLRLDVTARDDAASMDVVWSGPDTGGAEQAVPTDRLRPAYGRVTSTTVLDPSAPPDTTQARSVSEFADPTRSRLTARVNQAGLRTTVEYEADESGWGRQVATTQPGGNRVRFTYWGDTEMATSPCPGAQPTPQGGARRSVITPGPDGGDGPASTTWVDAAGREVAHRLGDGAIRCLFYDLAGRLSTTEVLGGEMVAREVVNYHVDGDPRVTDRLQTLGSEVLTRREVVDLLGRPVALVDEFGVRLDLAYDERTGNVATITTTAPGTAPIVTTQTYDSLGRPTAISVDGIVLATITNDADTVTRIRYANGVEMVATYNDLVRLTAMDWTTSDGERLGYEEQVTLAGLITSSTYRVGSQRSTARYVHDVAGRLAEMTIDAGVASEAGQWSYRYDDNSNRVSATVNGSTTNSIYDRADRLVGADLTYDARGNVTQWGTVSLRYDGSDHVVEVSDDDVTTTWRRDVHGTILTTTTQTATGSTTMSRGLGGMVLDGDGRAVAQRLELPGGAVLHRSLTNDADDTWTHTHLDGDTYFTTDSDGRRIGDVVLFTPFGEPIGTSTSTGWQSSHGVMEVTSSTPLIIMGARVYAPTLGRFLQLDPVAGGSANGYDYANQNPVHINDPTGESFLDWLPTAFVLSATLASMAFIPPATSFLTGAVVGALVTTGIKLGDYLIARAVGHDSPFTFAQAAEQVGLSFAFGGWGGYTGYTKTAAAVKFPVANHAWIETMLHHSPARTTPAPVTVMGARVETSSGIEVTGTSTAGVRAAAPAPQVRPRRQEGDWWSDWRRIVLPLTDTRLTR